MRPYLAVIHDSFRAARSSRVLYIVIGLIVMILLAIAPFHLRQQVDWQLNPRLHFPNPDRLARRLVDEGASGERLAVARVWNLLSPELQKDLKDRAEKVAEGKQDEMMDPGGVAPAFHRLGNELNILVARRDFYDEAAFAGKRPASEAQELLDRGVDSLADMEVKRLNRILLATALRRDIEMPGRTQLDFYYAAWQIEFLTSNITHAEFARSIVSGLPALFDNFVMSIGIFIAILVTASIIPEMLEPGSLNLLLSKPVWRWALLLAKFVGGCLFILICATLFFAGIWLWMGIQLGVWERALLLSIPVYLLVFAMYYSVSVLAGIWFRSPILSIAFAILFWGACFAVGFGYQRFDSRFYNLAPTEIVAAGDRVLLVDKMQRNKGWDSAEENWRYLSNRPLTEQDTGMEVATWFGRLDEIPDVAGPAWVASGNVVLAVDATATEVLSRATSGVLDLIALGAANTLESRTVGTLPAGTVALFDGGGSGVLAVDRSGMVWSRPVEAILAPPESGDSTDEGTGRESTASEEPADDSESGSASGLKRLFSRPTTGTGGFQRISDHESLNVARSGSASLDPESGEIALYSRGEVVVLRPDGEGRYTINRQRAVGEQENSRMTGLVQLRGSSLFLLHGNGQFYHLDSATLDEVWTGTLDSRVPIRGLAASSDIAAVTFREGRLWLYDARSRGELASYGFGLQGDVMATAFDARGRLWIGDRFQGARLYDLESRERVESKIPAADIMTQMFRWLVRPLYRSFPKPGEFNKVIARLSSSGDTTNNPTIDLTVDPPPDDPWTPLTSGLVFMFVMLGISCAVFQRMDF